MKKTSIIAIGALLVAGLFLTSAVLAGQGNDLPSGKHYNLNIHGAKNVGEVGDSSGHTMFVSLFSGSKPTKIIMTQDPNGVFQVTDRNGLDDGVAKFNIAPGYYDVYARALGKPGGNVEIISWAEFEDDNGNPIFKLGEVDLTRMKGKPQTVNINHLFCVDEITLEVGGETVTYKHEWVFDILELEEYWWDYDNKGLKLLQLRFYERTDSPCEPPA